MLYYLWTLTWGLGWVPALAALGGMLAVWRKERRLGLMLVPAPLLFLAFMGLQGRYFGRWLLPIFPILCLLAAFFALGWAALASARARSACGWQRPGCGRSARLVGVAALLVVALLAQGLVYSVHSGLVLSRADTRNLTRAWLVAHVPKGTPIVAEPVSPDEWAREVDPRDGNRGQSLSLAEVRLAVVADLRRRRARTGSSRLREVGIEDYVRTLSPALIGYYERNGYCWVVSGSTQSGRAFADPKAVPQAIAYYAALAKQGEVVYRASPYSHGRDRVAFDFDWSFDYYPLAYYRPGPEMTVYRLHGWPVRANSTPGIS